jgi:hypothetical protein
MNVFADEVDMFTVAAPAPEPGPPESFEKNAGKVELVSHGEVRLAPFTANAKIAVEPVAVVVTVMTSFVSGVTAIAHQTSIFS